MVCWYNYLKHDDLLSLEIKVKLTLELEERQSQICCFLPLFLTILAQKFDIVVVCQRSRVNSNTGGFECRGQTPVVIKNFANLDLVQISVKFT